MPIPRRSKSTTRPIDASPSEEPGADPIALERVHRHGAARREEHDVAPVGAVEHAVREVQPVDLPRIRGARSRGILAPGDACGSAARPRPTNSGRGPAFIVGWVDGVEHERGPRSTAPSAASAADDVETTPPRTSRGCPAPDRRGDARGRLRHCRRTRSRRTAKHASRPLPATSTRDSATHATVVEHRVGRHAELFLGERRRAGLRRPATIPAPPIPLRQSDASTTSFDEHRTRRSRPRAQTPTSTSPCPEDLPRRREPQTPRDARPRASPTSSLVQTGGRPGDSLPRPRRRRDVSDRSRAAPHYKEPGWFTRNVFNRTIAGLTRLGVSVWGSRVLEVPGRKTGEPRRTPVNLLTSTAGSTWCRRAATASGCATSARTTGASTCSSGSAAPTGSRPRSPTPTRSTILRAYLKRWKAEVGVFFDGVERRTPPTTSSAASPPSTPSSPSPRPDRIRRGDQVIGGGAARPVAWAGHVRPAANRPRRRGGDRCARRRRPGARHAAPRWRRCATGTSGSSGAARSPRTSARGCRTCCSARSRCS